jgi:hypothetical protein
MKRTAVFLSVAVFFSAAGYLLGHTATRDSAESAIRNHQNWRLRMYLMQGGSPNAATDVGSLLNYSLGEKGNHDAALMLIRGGAIIEHHGPGLSPLEAAMLACWPAVVAALLEADHSRNSEVLSRASGKGECPAGREMIAAHIASNISQERTRGK